MILRGMFNEKKHMSYLVQFLQGILSPFSVLNDSFRYIVDINQTFGEVNGSGNS